jgi:hypothetical protein
MSDETKPGSNPGIHETPADTRERVYQRARESGVTRDNARRIADEVARTVHNNRRDR